MPATTPGASRPAPSRGLRHPARVGRARAAGVGRAGALPIIWMAQACSPPASAAMDRVILATSQAPGPVMTRGGSAWAWDRRGWGSAPGPAIPRPEAYVCPPHPPGNAFCVICACVRGRGGATAAMCAAEEGARASIGAGMRARRDNNGGRISRSARRRARLLFAAAMGVWRGWEVMASGVLVYRPFLHGGHTSATAQACARHYRQHLAVPSFSLLPSCATRSPPRAKHTDTQVCELHVYSCGGPAVDAGYGEGEVRSPSGRHPKQGRDPPAPKRAGKTFRETAFTKTAPRSVAMAVLPLLINGFTRENARVRRAR